MIRRDQGLGGFTCCASQVNILLNVQFATRNKHSADIFLFIVLGIFLLFSLKGSPHPNPTIGCVCRPKRVAGWDISTNLEHVERSKRRHRARSGRDHDHYYGSCSCTGGYHKVLMEMVILAKYTETYDGFLDYFFGE